MWHSASLQVSLAAVQALLALELAALQNRLEQPSSSPQAVSRFSLAEPVRRVVLVPFQQEVLIQPEPAVICS